MEDKSDAEITRISHETQDFLEKKGLLPKQAIAVLTECLGEFVGYCANDRAAMERGLVQVCNLIKAGANIAITAKERGGLN